MPRGGKVSYPLSVNVILFVDRSNFLKQLIVYNMTFSIAHWDT